LHYLTKWILWIVSMSSFVFAGLAPMQITQDLEPKKVKEKLQSLKKQLTGSSYLSLVEMMTLIDRAFVLVDTIEDMGKSKKKTALNKISKTNDLLEVHKKELRDILMRLDELKSHSDADASNPSDKYMMLGTQSTAVGSRPKSPKRYFAEENVDVPKESAIIVQPLSVATPTSQSKSDNILPQE
jgi:hypothetical protein